MKSVLSCLIDRSVKLFPFLRSQGTQRGNLNNAGHATFTDWLQGDASVSEDGRYRHRRLDESAQVRAEILQDLQSYVEKAHEDARRHFRKLADISLDPLQAPSPIDPLAGYPALLHIDTLKSYLGEVLAGLICEYFRPFDEDGWKVPAFLFRFHDVAFHELERVRQTGQNARHRPGRFGSDCLAFLRSGEGNILRTLFCEAKCTSGHDSGMVAGAHRQVSDALLTPVDLPRLIEVLKDQGSSEGGEWAEALQRLWLGPRDASYERCDLVGYVCGQSPVRRASWIPSGAPHRMYSGRRRLEAVEIHLDDIGGLITQVYGREPSDASD